MGALDKYLGILSSVQSKDDRIQPSRFAAVASSHPAARRSQPELSLSPVPPALPLRPEADAASTVDQVPAAPAVEGTTGMY